jgi:hypothetical protein
VSEERSLELIEELAADLRPVRPIPRLRTALLVLVGAWIAVGALGVMLLGLNPELLQVLAVSRGRSVVLAGLALAGLGGLTAGLAFGVPGRERTAGSALLVALVGLAVAAGTGLTLVLATGPAATAATPAVHHLRCLAVACAVGLVPAAGLIYFAGHAWPYRSLAVAVAAAAGAAAMGAVSTQATCRAADAAHLLIGHVLAPGVGVLLLTLPLLLALRRFAR